jgi:hypothetical protein
VLGYNQCLLGYGASRKSSADVSEIVSTEVTMLPSRLVLVGPLADPQAVDARWSIWLGSVLLTNNDECSTSVTSSEFAEAK